MVVLMAAAMAVNAIVNLVWFFFIFVCLFVCLFAFLSNYCVQLHQLILFERIVWEVSFCVIAS